MPDSREHLVITLIDNTISLALSSLGFFTIDGENGRRSIGFDPDGEIKALGLAIKMMYRGVKMLAGRKVAKEFKDRDREAAASTSWSAPTPRAMSWPSCSPTPMTRAGRGRGGYQELATHHHRLAEQAGVVGRLRVRGRG